MKRHWKKIVLGLLAIALITGGYLLYLFQIKDYDVADEEIDKIIKEDYDIELPDGSSIGEDENREATGEESESGTGSPDEVESTATGNSADGVESAGTDVTASGSGQVAGASISGAGAGDASVGGSASKPGAGTKGSDSSSNGGAGGTLDGSGNVGNNHLSVADIKSRYTPSFESLQSQAKGRIDSLIGRAVNEYTTKKQNGESVSYGYFYQKYMGAAASLESQTDATFNKLMGALESELAKNGYNKSYAQSFRDQYNAEKEARRSSLIKKAMDNM